MNENEDEDKDKDKDKDEARLRPFCWSDDENHQSQWHDKDRSQNDQHDDDDFNNRYDVRFFPGGQLDAQGNGDGLPVDEVSDDEDERRAFEYLRSYSQNPNLAAQEDCSVRDILEEHHRRNCPNHPPSPTRLAAAASNQQALSQHGEEEDTQASSQRGEEEDTVDSEAQSNEREGNNQEQGQVVGQLAHTNNTCLRYYPKTWQTVIQDAKERFRFYIAVEKAFPTRSFDISDARACLMQSLAAHEEKGTELSD
ncbi:hypothetical protein CVT25_014678, partial [Psilocybe cyanescens]